MTAQGSSSARVNPASDEAVTYILPREAVETFSDIITQDMKRSTGQSRILALKKDPSHGGLGRLPLPEAMGARGKRAFKKGVESFGQNLGPAAINQGSDRDRTEVGGVGGAVLLGDQRGNHSFEARMPTTGVSHAIKHLRQAVPKRTRKGQELGPLE